MGEYLRNNAFLHNEQNNKCKIQTKKGSHQDENDMKHSYIRFIQHLIINNTSGFFSSS